MSPIDPESAMIQLYENESLTENLTDDAAQTLLKWAEAQIMTLAENNEDEAAFEELFTTLRRLTRTMNTFAGLAAQMDMPKQQTYMEEIKALATQLGFNVMDEQFSAYNASMTDLEETERVRQLIETIDPPRPPENTDYLLM
ncbi:MAG: hypothetical protein RLP44_32320 [Aggregatilineales bacterium]